MVLNGPTVSLLAVKVPKEKWLLNSVDSTAQPLIEIVCELNKQDWKSFSLHARAKPSRILCWASKLESASLSRQDWASKLEPAGLSQQDQQVWEIEPNLSQPEPASLNQQAWEIEPANRAPHRLHLFSNTKLLEKQDDKKTTKDKQQNAKERYRCLRASVRA